MRQGQGPTILSIMFCLIGLHSAGQSMAMAGEWSLPDTRVGIRTAPLLLLSRPDVQADLRLEPVQISGIHDTINELTRRALALRGKTGPAVMTERRAIDEAQAEWLARNLSGNQLARLRQIELQWEGARAMLSRPTVAEYLKLTPEQRQMLVRTITQSNLQRSRGASTSQDEQALSDAARSVLSKVQQELWANLLGTPCRFAMSSAAPRTRDAAAQQAGHTQEAASSRTRLIRRWLVERSGSLALGLGGLGANMAEAKIAVRAPSISVCVRVSWMSGLKPSESAKSRWQERLEPRSARPKARYISAYRHRTTLNDRRCGDFSSMSISSESFSHQRPSVCANDSRPWSPRFRASSAPACRASSTMTCARFRGRAARPALWRMPGSKGRRSWPRSRAARVVAALSFPRASVPGSV